MAFVKIADFTDADNKIRWSAYRQAQVDNGEYCYRCDGYVAALQGAGHQTLCFDCRNLDERHDEDVDHYDYIRCPSCGKQDKITAWDCDYSDEKYVEGSHEVFCSGCDYKYEIQTNVSYSYTSPPRLKEEKTE